MATLVDTGILLRLFDRADPAFPAILECIKRLRKGPHGPFVATQNLVEFWNVSTRSSAARGGYGLSTAIVEKRIRFLLSTFIVLYPSPESFNQWRQLVVQHQVQGVQVHDTQLVSLMHVAKINCILTLNRGDFSRFSGVVALTPIEFLAQPPSENLPGA